MITRPTVLILGAGASMDYGFPSGFELRRQILTDLRQSQSRKRAILRQLEHDDQEIDAFIEDFAFSGRLSIDAYLENRPEHLELGRKVIAASLIPYEAEETLQAGYDGDGKKRGMRWYDFLWQRLDTEPGEVIDNRLSIITFNYDRSLEHYLHLALVKSYKMSHDDAVGMLFKRPVIYVHGNLSELPYIEQEGSRGYNTHIDAPTVAAVASKIRIIHELQKDDPQFAMAHEVLREAEVVCILGFGYHPKNIQRLRLKEMVSEEVCIYGTALGLLDGEVKEAINLIGHRGPVSGIEYMRLEDKDCLTLLRHFRLLS